MVTKFSLTAAALAIATTFGMSTAANAVPTDVLVQDGAGNVIATGVHTFDENEAGSGLALGFTPVAGSTFTFLYQANVVSFNDAGGQAITPSAGLNASALPRNSRIEPKAGSCVTAMKGTPRSRSAFIHPFHKPRLQP